MRCSTVAAVRSATDLYDKASLINRCKEETNIQSHVIKLYMYLISSAILNEKKKKRR